MKKNIPKNAIRLLYGKPPKTTALTDRCPNCEEINQTYDYEELIDYVAAKYRCRICSNRWVTNYDKSVLDQKRRNPQTNDKVST